MRAARGAVALQPLQFGAQVGRVLVAKVAVFFERAIDDFFELGRQVGIQANGCDRLSIQDGVEDDAGGISAKWQAARGHFIQHNAEREQVRARIEWRAAHLFRRHVSDRAHRAAGAG